LSVAGIKVALPLYIVEREMCFLELYLAHIASMQRMHGQGRVLPIAIMTSDDTHDLTERLLAAKAVSLTCLRAVSLTQLFGASAWPSAMIARRVSCASLEAQQPTPMSSSLYMRGAGGGESGALAFVLATWITDLR